MSFVDPIGDMITRIRNAQLRALFKVKIPSSKFREKILIRYHGFNELILHLRKMAMTNILIDQNNYKIGKKFYSMIIDMFKKDIKKNGITYEFLIATAWTKD